MEHRWGSRFALEHPVRIRSSGALVSTGALRNVSLSGGLLHTTAPFRLNCRIVLQLGGVPKAERVVEAMVVRRAAEGLGIEWTELAPAVIRQLLRELNAVPVGAVPQQVAVHAERPELRGRVASEPWSLGHTELRK